MSDKEIIHGTNVVECPHYIYEDIDEDCIIKGPKNAQKCSEKPQCLFKRQSRINAALKNASSTIRYFGRLLEDKFALFLWGLELQPDSVLEEIYNRVLFEMNERKLKQEDKKGKSKEKDSSDLDLIVWFDNVSGIEIPEFNKDEFLNKVRDLANSYGLDYYFSSSPKGARIKFEQLEKMGYFNGEEEQ